MYANRVFPAFLLLLTALSVAPPAQAQSQKTIIVLDASGSMWGQIDGEAKITIAKRVLTDLLDTLPPETELGLTAYGHREKGQCGDIELLVAPGAGTRDAIRAAVAGISPKGKTPLSAAVIAAAEDLKYGEEAATVILISDGVETCDLDPCAVGRQLEQTGVGFTAHVIGFDVTEKADRAQLSCLAEETGGRFLTADTATELAQALVAVADPPAPPPSTPPLPQTVDAEFVATDGENGPVVTGGLMWSLDPEADEGTTLENFDIARLRMAVRPGVYAVTVDRPATEDSVTAPVTIAPGAANSFTIALPSSIPDATLSAPDNAVAGSQVAVGWTGPGADRDYISVTVPGDTGRYINHAYLRDGNPVSLTMPPRPGTYELRYVQSPDNAILTTRTITVMPVAATLDAPARADAAAQIVVNWTGPDYPRDYIAVAEVGADDGAYVNYTYSREGSPLRLTMPAPPGAYELRYVMAQDRTVIARAPIVVAAVAATLSGPAQAEAGSSVVVAWEGPDNDRDYIAVSEPGSDDNAYVNYTYTREGSPLRLTMPAQPGAYQLRYVLNEGRTVIARAPLNVAAATATVTAPAQAEAGSSIVVQWSGPDNARDYIAVAQPGAEGGSYVNYTYTRDGSPLHLTMPAEPGSYELRYVLAEGRSIVASTPISVVAATANLSAPAEAPAGSSLLVEWTGPDNRGDFVSLATPDADDGKYVTYAYTRDGSPLRIKLPGRVGNYELRYVLNEGRKVIARKPLGTLAVDATLSAPDTAPAGAPVIVTWTGPDYDRDYISIAEEGAPNDEYETYAYTRDGASVAVTVPTRPGRYELRYVIGSDRTILARRALAAQ